MAFLAHMIQSSANHGHYVFFVELDLAKSIQVDFFQKIKALAEELFCLSHAEISGSQKSQHCPGIAHKSELIQFVFELFFELFNLLLDFIVDLVDGYILMSNSLFHYNINYGGKPTSAKT